MDRKYLSIPHFARIDLDGVDVDLLSGLRSRDHWASRDDSDEQAVVKNLIVLFQIINSMQDCWPGIQPVECAYTEAVNRAEALALWVTIQRAWRVCPWVDSLSTKPRDNVAREAWKLFGQAREEQQSRVEDRLLVVDEPTDPLVLFLLRLIHEDQCFRRTRVPTYKSTVHFDQNLYRMAWRWSTFDMVAKKAFKSLFDKMWVLHFVVGNEREYEPSFAEITKKHRDWSLLRLKSFLDGKDAFFTITTGSTSGRAQDPEHVDELHKQHHRALNITNRIELIGDGSSFLVVPKKRHVHFEDDDPAPSEPEPASDYRAAEVAYEDLSGPEDGGSPMSSSSSSSSSMGDNEIPLQPQQEVDLRTTPLASTATGFAYRNRREICTPVLPLLGDKLPWRVHVRVDLLFVDGTSRSVTITLETPCDLGQDFYFRVEGGWAITKLWRGRSNLQPSGQYGSRCTTCQPTRVWMRFRQLVDMLAPGEEPVTMDAELGSESDLGQEVSIIMPAGWYICGPFGGSLPSVEKRDEAIRVIEEATRRDPGRYSQL